MAKNLSHIVIFRRPTSAQCAKPSYYMMTVNHGEFVDIELGDDSEKVLALFDALQATASVPVTFTIIPRQEG